MGETVSGKGTVQSVKPPKKVTFRISFSGNDVDPGCLEGLLKEFKKLAKERCGIKVDIAKS